MDYIIKNVKRWQARVGSACSIRVSETNTLSGGGKMGVSNTMAAALYHLDIALALAFAGIAGLNFHTPRCSPYTSVAYPQVSELASHCPPLPQHAAPLFSHHRCH